MWRKNYAKISSWPKGKKQEKGKQVKSNRTFARIARAQIFAPLLAGATR